VVHLQKCSFMSVPLLALVFLVRAVATWLPALIG
jgi:hypothetical protein